MLLGTNTCFMDQSFWRGYPGDGFEMLEGYILGMALICCILWKGDILGLALKHWSLWGRYPRVGFDMLEYLGGYKIGNVLE
ncbi:hypothetical protein BY996DRAFT_6622480 [Phakopsora pachyrhizi]|uniref:Uncharacterized protein n=1 Tax=Phakopsora pachyrhizi TaxID=170000 RepID=A0AAV0AZ31_PHAPC|nr:hypothetical protein BY996DRAFT_6622480 [Phakopsora pachyrhizi]CAH7674598.1 hypothetical protein PPACK8108_LOCUS9504 [Phakopsora pachyrhizi]